MSGVSPRYRFDKMAKKKTSVEMLYRGAGRGEGGGGGGGVKEETILTKHLTFTSAPASMRRFTVAVL